MSLLQVHHVTGIGHHDVLLVWIRKLPIEGEQSVQVGHVVVSLAKHISQPAPPRERRGVRSRGAGQPNSGSRDELPGGNPPLFSNHAYPLVADHFRNFQHVRAHGVHK